MKKHRHVAILEFVAAASVACSESVSESCSYSFQELSTVPGRSFLADARTEEAEVSRLADDQGRSRRWGHLSRSPPPYQRGRRTMPARGALRRESPSQPSRCPHSRARRAAANAHAFTLFGQSIVGGAARHGVVQVLIGFHPARRGVASTQVATYRARAGERRPI